ncbi:MAG: VWA domain-containing protein [Selenomonadaceae bacterium]|nr:VWA domain-containing protein [Selenomonadaceae bacterium]
MSAFSRRLPVYLLLDCSASMSGEPLEAVQQGLKTFVNELKGDPQALETVCLSVITFGSVAQQVNSLTELTLFKEPKLKADGLTALGGALKVLRGCIAREYRKATDTQKGDWLPLVFILTDDPPTYLEEFDRQVKDIKTLKAANIIAMGVEPYVDQASLKRITDNVLLMNSASAGDMAKFFAWVSDSIRITTLRFGELPPLSTLPRPKKLDLKPGANIQLAPPPQGFTIVP